MSEDELKRHSNPDSFLTDPVDVFDAVAEPVPPGTKAPPRPPGKERERAGNRSRNEGVNVLPAVEGQVQPLAPAQPQPEVAALVARIESALETIHTALAEIKRIQSPPQTQSKAG
jgi:hypothetical protein